jgi:hypothetical protein
MTPEEAEYNARLGAALSQMGRDISNVRQQEQQQHQQQMQQFQQSDQTCQIVNMGGGYYQKRCY